MQNSITKLFNIQIPLVQAGMVWCSGWRLASAVSNAGGLGLIGSGSMYPEVLRNHINACKKATNKPFGVNLPLLYPEIKEHLQVILEENIKIVFTSAGNPTKYTRLLKDNGIIVVHVVSNSKFARKAEDAGVDAVVAEGFEAGGHNGREENTTFCLIPMVCESVNIPVIAAGGISSGKSMLAAFTLGAEGVQIGTRFVASVESSAHPDFKSKVLAVQEGETFLTMKKLTPVRLIRNVFFKRVETAEGNCASEEDLKQLLGKGRAKLGMFEGNLEEGELEIGQVAALVKDIKPAAEIVSEIWKEFLIERERIIKLI